MSFVHLHVHTVYSLFDGLAKINDLFKRAEQLGMPALAITDHGTLSGVPEFLYEASRHPSVKPIVGCEVYATRHNHCLHPEGHGSSHLILLAKNSVGYRNLLKIVSEAGTAGLNGKPCISYDYVFAHSDGLIATSACIGGDIPKAILAGNMPLATQLAKRMKDAFGDDFYLEVCEHESRKRGHSKVVLEMQRTVTKGVFLLARQLDIKVVATNDVHFCNRDDAAAHDVLLCANTETTMDNPDRFSYSGQEYLKSGKEMAEVFPEHPEVLENTIELASKVEFFDVTSLPSAPAFPLPEGAENSMDYLNGLAWKGLSERGLSASPEAGERLSRELAEIREYDRETEGALSNHFLIVRDLLREMRLRGIPVGPGRGSAAGSLLNYVLFITDVNPLGFGLLFERFIHFPRMAGRLPDIDIDFGRGGFSAAFRYLQEKYGAGHVSHVVNFGRRSGDRAMEDALRAYGITDSASEPNNALRGLAYDAADRLEGTKPASYTHSCAVLLSKDPLDSCVPLKLSFEDDVPDLLSAYDCRFVEKYGPVKYCFLEQYFLDVIDRASEGKEIEYPLDDPDTLRIFTDADTAGVAFFESSVMRRYLSFFRPDCFNDIVLLYAVCRPGAFEWLPELKERKDSGRINVTFPGTENLLADSYGLPVYQEQLASILKKVGGFSSDEADTLRKNFTKKQTEDLAGAFPKFLSGGLERGYKRQDLTGFWQDMLDRAWLMFSKSHTVCYALISYRCAYLKTHLPENFRHALSTCQELRGLE